jgi:hypothetical protein
MFWAFSNKTTIQKPGYAVRYISHQQKSVRRVRGTLLLQLSWQHITRVSCTKLLLAVLTSTTDLNPGSKMRLKDYLVEYRSELLHTYRLLSGSEIEEYRQNGEESRKNKFVVRDTPKSRLLYANSAFDRMESDVC